MFGKKKSGKPPEPPRSPPPSSGGEERPAGSELPWATWPDVIGCNFAFGHLVRNFTVPLTVDGRVHAETMMCAAGAVAGACAHISLLADKAAMQRAQHPGGISIVTLNDGRNLMFGDAINDMLVSNDPALAPQRAWNIMAGASISAGLAEADLPPLEHMFAHVTKSLGGPREGFPSVEDKHQPHHSAQEVLKRVWGLAHDCLTGEIDEVCRKNGFAAAKTSWSAVTARAAGRMLTECAAVLSPRTALIIGMESAIYASKLMTPTDSSTA